MPKCIQSCSTSSARLLETNRHECSSACNIVTADTVVWCRTSCWMCRVTGTPPETLRNVEDHGDVDFSSCDSGRAEVGCRQFFFHVSGDNVPATVHMYLHHINSPMLILPKASPAALCPGMTAKDVRLHLDVDDQCVPCKGATVTITYKMR